MLTKIKKHVIKIMYEYHYHLSNYYLGKIDIYDSESNAKDWDKAHKHMDKELVLVEKLVQL